MTKVMIELLPKVEHTDGSAEPVRCAKAVTVSHAYRKMHSTITESKDGYRKVLVLLLLRLL